MTSLTTLTYSLPLLTFSFPQQTMAYLMRRRRLGLLIN